MTTDEYQLNADGVQAGAVPVIDIGGYSKGSPAQRQEVVDAVRDACTHVGFFVVTGHAVSPRLVTEMRAVSAEFFDLPEDEKARYTSDPGKTMGYVPVGRESLAATLDASRPPDLKEIFDICRPDVPDDQYYRSEMGQKLFRQYDWPERPDRFRRVWTEYYRALEDVAATIMEVFALALELPHDYFRDKTDRSVDYLRVINYPAQGEAPAHDQLRAGEHTDYGTVTLVATDDAPGGLQVHTKAETWADVPYVPDSFVVNIGDMMAQWTNDAWVSTLHRVANPDVGVSSSRRQSVVFFQNPNYDTVIEPIETCVTSDNPAQFAPVSAGEWLLRKTGKQRV